MFFNTKSHKTKIELVQAINKKRKVEFSLTYKRKK